MSWWPYIIACFVIGFIFFELGYWMGKDSGSNQAFKWRMKYEEKHREHVLLEQRARGLQHELDFFYPETVWRNERWTPPDEPYGSP